MGFRFSLVKLFEFWTLKEVKKIIFCCIFFNPIVVSLHIAARNKKKTHNSLASRRHSGVTFEQEFLFQKVAKQLKSGIAPVNQLFLSFWGRRRTLI
jgi:hypothetical protein